MQKKRPWIGLSVFFFSVLACNIGVLPPQEDSDEEQESTLAVRVTPVDAVQTSTLVPTESLPTPTLEGTDTAPAIVPPADTVTGTSSLPTVSIRFPTEITLPGSQPGAQDPEKPSSPPSIAPTNTPISSSVRGGVTGVEVDGTNPQPVAMAKVRIEPGDFVVTTNSKGEYQFDSIPVGEITILVGHSKYETGIRTVTVKAGQPNVFNFVVKKTVPHEVTPCPFIFCPPIPIPTIADNPFFDPGGSVGN